MKEDSPILKVKQKILSNNYIKQFVNNDIAIKIIILIVIFVLAYVSYSRIDKIKYLKGQLEIQNEIIQLCKEGKSTSTGVTYFMGSYWDNELENAEKEKSNMNIQLIFNISVCSIGAIASLFILVKNKNRLLKRSKTDG